MIDMTGVDMTEDMPENLSCKLLPHQVQGIQWLKSRETGKNRGGILADDVGNHSNSCSCVAYSCGSLTDGSRQSLPICNILSRWSDS